MTNADSKFFLDNEYNIEETISYAKLRGWAETQILADVQQRLSKAEDINQQIDGGSTPIMSAAAEGYISIVRLLLDAGADLKRKNRWKEDVISCAKLSGNKEIINLIKNSLNDKNRAPSAVSVCSLYFRPKENIEAEYTFYPSKQFKTENHLTVKDVGFFLNSKEVLKLEPIKDSSKRGDALVIFINEGKVMIKIDAWDALPQDKATALLEKFSVDVHDISNIIREYLSD